MRKDSARHLTATLVLGLWLGARYREPDSTVARAAVHAIRRRAAGRCAISFPAVLTDRYVAAPL